MCMTEVLYLNNRKLSDLRTVCSDQLVLSVFEDYGSRHKIIISNDEYPHGRWSINRYLEDPGMQLESKVKAIVAFAYLGGTIEFEDGISIFGDTNVLSELLQRGYINQNEYACYTHEIYEARQGREPLRFNMSSCC